MKSIAEMLRGAMKPAEKKKEKGAHKTALALDGVEDGGYSGAADPAGYAGAYISGMAASTIQQWAEVDDLDDGETAADRLMAMMVGIADSNKDGELSDDEQEVVGTALEASWEYLSSLGVPDDDISLLLNDWDVAAGERIRDLVASVLPDGDDAASAAVDAFTFGPDDQEAMLDSTGAVLDAAYKKVVAVRRGKKVRINKRISGTVRLSAKQKVAIRKAGMKSHSAAALARRMKSLRVRKSLGM